MGFGYGFFDRFDEVSKAFRFFFSMKGIHPLQHVSEVSGALRRHDGLTDFANPIFLILQLGRSPSSADHTETSCVDKPSA
ncbi:hypothetical protein ATY77_03775 [Rhizobium sp. R634]|nr:hypothetical protein ATY77_03775 [Rhizobium sp. R634]